MIVVHPLSLIFSCHSSSSFSLKIFYILFCYSWRRRRHYFHNWELHCAVVDSLSPIRSTVVAAPQRNANKQTIHKHATESTSTLQSHIDKAGWVPGRLETGYNHGFAVRARQLSCFATAARSRRRGRPVVCPNAKSQSIGRYGDNQEARAAPPQQHAYLGHFLRHEHRWPRNWHSGSCR